MSSSLKRKLAFVLGITICAGIFSSTYVLIKFNSYKNKTTQLLTGEKKSILTGQMLEAKIQAAQELVSASVATQEANDAFREKIETIAQEIKQFSKEHSDSILEDAQRTANLLLQKKKFDSNKSETVEDLFVQYRNMKTFTFNLYRTAWSNKWMSVAKTVGLIVNDLDNLPYNSAEKAAASIYPKLSQISAVVASSGLPQATKVFVLGQLSHLKSQIAHFSEFTEKAHKTKAERQEQLQLLSSLVRRYNENQTKNIGQFTSVVQSEYVKGIIAFLIFILFSICWYFFVSKSFINYLLKIAGHVSQQLNHWVSSSSNILVQHFHMPEKLDNEFKEMYLALDVAIRKINTFRKEDVLVKRLLNVPFVLMNKQKQAIYWNSSLSQLGKIRTVEELGLVLYTGILKFTDAKGNSIDPIEKCFNANQEIMELALLKVTIGPSSASASQDKVAVQVICTPVLGPDQQAEYVMTHIRDLREENRRAEAELERQLVCVRQAAFDMKCNQTPQDPPEWVRQPVQECIHLLKNLALEGQTEKAVLLGQMQTIWERIGREANIKHAIHKRMEQVRDEVTEIRQQLNYLRNFADTIVVRIVQIEKQNQVLNQEYQEIKKRGALLLDDFKKNQVLIGACLDYLKQAEALVAQVKSQEARVQNVFESASILNANNSILGSKGELSHMDIMSITDNISQILNQFEKATQLIHDSIGDVESGLNTLTLKLGEDLNTCLKLASDDQAILSTVKNTENILNQSTQDLRRLTKDIASLKLSAYRANMHFQGVEHKAQHLVQIGQTSIELQTQLEEGFKSVLTKSQMPIST